MQSLSCFYLMLVPTNNRILSLIPRLCTNQKAKNTGYNKTDQMKSSQIFTMLSYIIDHNKMVMSHYQQHFIKDWSNLYESLLIFFLTCNKTFNLSRGAVAVLETGRKINLRWFDLLCTVRHVCLTYRQLYSWQLYFNPWAHRQTKYQSYCLFMLFCN